MGESIKRVNEGDSRRPPIPRKDIHHLKATHLNVTNCLGANNVPFDKTPKRKLSVFYRSFDVITPTNQGEKETVEVRRSSSSPSVRVEEKQDGKPKDRQSSEEKSSCKDTLVNYHRPLLDSTESSSGSSPEHLLGNFSTKDIQHSTSRTVYLDAPKLALPRVKEDTTISESGIIESSFGDCPSSPRPENEKFKSILSTFMSMDQQKTELGTSKFSLTPASSYESRNISGARAFPVHDPVKIKDSEYPRSFTSTENTDRFTATRRPVRPEMSSREDSSIGSESEDDSIERVNISTSTCVGNTVGTKKENQPAETDLSQTTFVISGRETSRNSDIKRNGEDETEVVTDFHSKRQKRQRFLGIKRSLSDGEDDVYGQSGCRCKHIARKDSLGDQEDMRIFPSLTNRRLRLAGLSTHTEMEAVYRENLPEDELERKYIAFSIGLSTDRITLHKRMALYLRQRDLSECNLTEEVQRMQQDIQELSPLCTDRESIEKVERVRHRLDMISRCAHRVSCTAESLGAMRQEHRISGAVLIADRYLQVLRTRCENLTAEIAEIRRILLKNNIVIEETSGELDGDLPRIRYRSGLTSNNRTMIARRRASIATIPRPLATPADINKDGPKQRNSVSGRMTLRRPSLCFESQKWENEKLNRTDSSSTVGELRDIFEQAESRRASFEENNNVLRAEQHVNLDTVNFTTTEDEVFTNNKEEHFEDSDTPPNVGKNLQLCIKTAESLRITRNLATWKSMLCYVIIFFLGFYVKHVISSTNSHHLSSRKWWSSEEFLTSYLNESASAVVQSAFIDTD